jgi:hypothetical protein
MDLRAVGTKLDGYKKYCELSVCFRLFFAGGKKNDYKEITAIEGNGGYSVVGN